MIRGKVDGVGVQMLKEGGKGMSKWLTGIYNSLVCLESGKLLEDRKRAYIVLLYKGKGEKSMQ